MKKTRLLMIALLSLVLTSLTASQVFAQDEGSGLRVKIECEEPTGIFLDSETVALRRAMLFSIHVFNETDEVQNAVINWRVRDVTGKVVRAGDQKQPVPAGGYVSRRELFTAPSRGAFSLEATAFARRKGADLKAESEFSFAVIAAPQKDERPFLLLDAPLDLTERKLEILSRLGARALRTEIPLEGNVDDLQTVEARNAVLTAREARGLATVGVLVAPRGEGTGRSRDDEEWLQAALRVMSQTPSIRTWEVTGRATADSLSELSRAAHNMTPARSVFTTSRPAGDWKRLSPPDGLIYTLRPLDAGVHPAALRRNLLGAGSRARENGLGSFHVRGVVEADNSSKARALESAQGMMTQTVLAIIAGAQGASTKLFADNHSDRESLARGAAFSALNAQLGNAEFHEELFPPSPIIMGAVFGKVQNAGSVAVLWTAPGQDGREAKGTLEAWLPDAQVFDVFGNVALAGERRVFNLPLSSQPVFVTSNSTPEAMARGLREGFVTGIDPLSAQLLPLEQPIEYGGEMKPKDNKFAPSNKLALRVRLHNTGVGSVSGTLKLNPPPSWQLEVSSREFELKEGESRIYDFPVSLVKPNDKYPVRIDASGVLVNGDKSVRGNWRWAQEAQIATALNVQPQEPINIDGSLEDWGRAQWMSLDSKTLRSQLALKWDTTRLYIAAKVREPRLKAREDNNRFYDFWQGSDAIQLGFGLRDAQWMQPGSQPFRDTDYGFLLSPFHTRADGTIDARVLRLWSPQIPFGTLADRLRWGGAVPGAKAEIRRNERTGETFYEASIPLTAITDLNPDQRRATAQEFGSAVRFGWVLHNDEGENLQWAKVNNVFDWWNHGGSFLPGSDFSYAAQTMLGFTQQGEVAVGGSEPAAVQQAPIPTPVLPPAPQPGDLLPPYIPAPTVQQIPPPVEAIPAPTEPISPPAPQPSPPPQPTPQPPAATPLPAPVPIENLPPDYLPPAPPPQ